jgi:hypothetical protein
MKYIWYCCGLLAVAAGAGCIQSHHTQPVAYYTPAVEPVPPPTSDRPAPVYVAPDSDTTGIIRHSEAPPAGVSSQDVALAESISHLLKGDSHMASISENVQTTVEHGVVTLQGTVPGESARDEIGMRVWKLPGVVHVYNQLAVSYR